MSKANKSLSWLLSENGDGFDKLAEQFGSIDPFDLLKDTAITFLFGRFWFVVTLFTHKLGMQGVRTFAIIESENTHNPSANLDSRTTFREKIDFHVGDMADIVDTSAFFIYENKKKKGQLLYDFSEMLRKNNRYYQDQ